MINALTAATIAVAILTIGIVLQQPIAALVGLALLGGVLIEADFRGDLA